MRGAITACVAAALVGEKDLDGDVDVSAAEGTLAEAFAARRARRDVATRHERVRRVAVHAHEALSQHRR